MRTCRCIVVIHSYGVWVGYYVYCLFFLFGHGFLRRNFTDRREIWHEASPISQSGLLKFWGRYPQGEQNYGPFSFLKILDLQNVYTSINFQRIVQNSVELQFYWMVTQKGSCKPGRSPLGNLSLMYNASKLAMFSMCTNCQMCNFVGRTYMYRSLRTCVLIFVSRNRNQREAFCASVTYFSWSRTWIKSSLIWCIVGNWKL